MAAALEHTTGRRQVVTVTTRASEPSSSSGPPVKAWEWVRGNRVLAVCAALVLVFVPTVFTVFPGWAQWSVTQRLLVMAAWLFAAGVVAMASQKWESRMEEVTTQTHLVVVRAAVEARLRPAESGVPAVYEMTVYIYDKGHDKLLPWYPDHVVDVNDYRVFAPGDGATGAAYHADAPVVAVGDAVHNDEWNLTSLQQIRFDAYNAVAAAPIRRLDGHRVGCVTAIAHGNDGFFASDDGVYSQPGVDALQATADKIGTYLPP